MKKWKLVIVGLVVALVLLVVVAWVARGAIARFCPITHAGKVMRIGTFHKGGLNRKAEGTRQLRQFALVFEDGFQCEAYDTSFSTVREGDFIKIRGYHDVKGWPIFDPEWWECDEAQLLTIRPPAESAKE